MRNLLQRSANRPFEQTKSPWLRWVALACVLLVCVMGTAQVCHTHFVAAPRHDSQQNVPTPQDQDHCPLCMAMHSALPATLHVAPGPILESQRVDAPSNGMARVHRWSLKMASRPPPVGTNRA